MPKYFLYMSGYEAVGCRRALGFWLSPFLYGEVSGCFVWCWWVNEKVEVWDTSYVEVRIWLDRCR